MSSLLITILLFVGASVQTLIPPWAFIGSLEWPVLTGLLYGVLSPAPLGVAMPFFLLLSIGLYALRDEIFSDQIVTYSVLGLLSVLFKTVYFTIVFSASGLRPLQPGAAVVRIAGGFILGSLTAPVIYLFVSALRHMLPKSRRRI